ncbi:MAG: hypothetical protein QOE95_2254, partial [Gaiellaceae bacterium]|nr:hypothetical protein [Gaiellaceae bacterium]
MEGKARVLIEVVRILGEGMRRNLRGRRRAKLPRAVVAICLLPFAFCLLPSRASAQYAQPPVGPVPTGNSTEVLKKVDIEQRLGNQIPLDLKFRDESGREVRLGE